MSITAYTWIDGEFWLREGREWKHLAEYPDLLRQDRELRSRACLEHVEHGFVDCSESEGWYLHTQWHGGVIRVTEPPKGWAKHWTIVKAYFRIGWKQRGIKSLPLSLWATLGYFISLERRF